MAHSLPSIDARAIDHSYGDRRVLTNIDLTVPPSARIGLIGENGVGKSTLLRILAGIEQPDAGSVSRPPRTGILWQEAPVDETATVAALIDEYTADVICIRDEFEEAAAALDGTVAGGERLARALDAADRAEVWTLDSRRDEVLAVLGVAALGLDRPIASVSGGQRSRIALAGLLLGRPDALLLDEPTNHLDDAAVDYLTARLREWRGPILFASHDRAFLDEVATGLVDLDPDRARTATRYGGAFTDYLAEKARERERWEQQHRSEQDEVKRLDHAVVVTSRAIAHDRPPRDNDKFLRDFKKGTVQKQISRRVQNASRRLDDLRETQVRKPPAILSFAGIPAGTAAVGEESDTLVDVSDVRVLGRLALDRLTVTSRDRVLVTGPNGAGKSTLLALLGGDLVADEGAVRRRKGLRVGLLRQDVRFPDAARTPRQLYAAAVGARRLETTPLSSLGLVPPAQIDRPVGTLSVGQQRRLALAMVLAKPPHLFLLDEPSNHLSLALASELEEALDGYPGAVVIASHDRWLRRRWTGRVVSLGGRLEVGVGVAR